jgi:hypothetical protein
MARWRGIAGILLGGALVAVGVTGAVTFHKFIFGVTFWRDVLIFSGVAVMGAALIVVSVLHLLRSRNRVTTQNTTV